MKNLRSLKTIVEKDVAQDLRLRNQIAFIPYLIAVLMIIVIATANSGIIIIPDKLYTAVLIISPILIILSVLFKRYLEKELLMKANLLMVGFFRIEMIELLKNYFGEDRISEHGKIIKKIFSELTDMPLCQLDHDGHIKTPSKIEFEPLKHIFIQNGEVTVLVNFELNEDGDIKMNYIKNENPGDFKQHQFPYVYKH